MELKLRNDLTHTNWLMLGCNHPVVMAFTEAIASKPPAAPRQCPIIDWNKMNKHTTSATHWKKHHRRLLHSKLGTSWRKHAQSNFKERERDYLRCIDFDPWSVLEYLLYSIYLSKVTSNSGSCMCIYVVNLKN